MSEKEQKKRRFVVHLHDQVQAVGVVCEGYDWGTYGLRFWGNFMEDVPHRRGDLIEGSSSIGTSFPASAARQGWRHIVFGVLPTLATAFHELTENQEWPGYVDRVYVEGKVLYVDKVQEQARDFELKDEEGNE